MLTKLGKYEVKSELGRGAMGVVYLGVDPRLGRQVALKTMSPAVAEDPELVQRFYREARSAGSLHHPNIVTIYDIDEADGLLFIAMEFLEGESLEKIIQARKELPILKKLDIVIQVCKGLHYAHQHEIVHRDVKAANLVVLSDGLVKIVDFGIARIASTVMTRAGIVMGTPMYMAPEQIRGEPADHRADIFSVGVILYEILTYTNPFKAPDITSIMFKIVNYAPAPLASVLPNCPPDLEAIVQHALAKDKEKRYQSGEDLAFDLQQVADYIKRHLLEDYIEEGQRCLKQGNLALAKVSLQKALQIDSNHNIAKNLLVKVKEQILFTQNQERIKGTLPHAKSLLESEQYDESIKLFDEILLLDPEHMDAKECKERALERRDGKLKVSWLLERAGKMAAEGDLKGTKAQLEEVLALDPQQTSAHSMLGWVSRELAEHERQRQVRNYIAAASAQLEEKNYTQALDLLQNARDLDPVHIEVESLTLVIRSDQEKEERRRILESRLAKIQDALSRELFEDGLALAQQAMREFPGDPQVLKLHTQATHLADIQRKRRYVDEQLQAARDFFLKNQYAEAVRVLQKALETVPEDTRMVSLLKSVEEAQERARLESLQQQAIREANDLIRDKNFTLAIETVERAQARAGKSAELQGLLQFALGQRSEHQRRERVRDLLSRAQSFLRDDKYGEALRLLEEGQTQLKSEEINTLLATAWGQLQQFERRRDETIEGARQLLMAGEAAKALAFLEVAPRAYLENAKFQAIFDQCREGVKRGGLIQAAVEQIDESIKKKNLPRAEELLRQALQTYQDEPNLLSAQNRLQEAQLKARQADWRKVLDDARAAIGQKNYHLAKELMKGLPPELAQFPELSSQAQALQARALEEQARREQESARHAREKATEEIGAEAQALSKAKDFERSMRVLEAGLKTYPGESRLVELQRTTMAAYEREQAVSEAIQRCQALREKNQLSEAIQLAQKSLQKYSGEPVLLDLQKQLAAQQVRARNQVLKELRKLDQAIRVITDPAEQEGLHKKASILANQWPADKEVKSLIAGIAEFWADKAIPLRPKTPLEKTADPPASGPAESAPQLKHPLDVTIAAPPTAVYARSVLRAAAPAAAPPAAVQPKPRTGRIWAVLAAVVVLGCLAALPSLLKKKAPGPSVTTVPVEILTKPEGAKIRVNNQECVTPACRLSLSSGTYQLVAQMPGYQTQVKSFSVEAEKPEGSASISLTLTPIPVAPAAAEAGGGTAPAPNVGTLVVETGEPSVEVFLDDKRYGVTASDGLLRVPLEVNEYAVRVEKSGYELVSPRRVRIRKNAEAKLRFKLVQLPQMATLSILGALPDAKIVLGGNPVGTVRPDGAFSTSVSPGDYTIELTKDQYSPVRLRKTFSAGKTVTIAKGEVDQSLIPPAPTIPPKPAVTAVDQQQQDWTRISNSTDPNVFEEFRKKYPTGQYADQAAKRIEPLEWDSAKSSKDPAVLKAFVAKYPGGPFAQMAQLQIQALQPPPTVQVPPHRQAILEAVRRYAAAVERKNLAEALAVWPSLTKKDQNRLKESFKQFRSIRMEFRPVGDPQISGETAKLVCTRVVESVDDQGAHPSQTSVTVGLRQGAGHWNIESIE